MSTSSYLFTKPVRQAVQAAVKHSKVVVEMEVPGMGDAPEEPVQRLADLVEQARRDYADTADRLASACRSLALNMEYVARRADKAASFQGTVINSLGEVQSEGGSIDALCAKLGAQRDHIALLEGHLGVNSKGLNAAYFEAWATNKEVASK